MQPKTVDFAPGAATRWSRPNIVVWRPTGASTWRTGRNIRVVMDSSVFPALWFMKTRRPSTKPEIHYISHWRQRRTEPRLQRTRTKHSVKFGHAVFQIRKPTDTQTRRSQYFVPLPGRSSNAKLSWDSTTYVNNWKESFFMSFTSVKKIVTEGRYSRTRPIL